MSIFENAIRASLAGHKSLASELKTLSEILSAKVADFELPFSSKIDVIEQTYSEDLRLLSKNRNSVATLRALIVSRVAGEILVNVRSRSANGRAHEILKPANTLTSGEAKSYAAEIKELMRRQEMPQREKDFCEQLDAVKKTAEEAQALARSTITDDIEKLQKQAFDFCLAESMRPELTRRLCEIRLGLVKLSDTCP